MTAASRRVPVTAASTRLSKPHLLNGVSALLERDAILLRRGVPDLLMRSLVQPLLFVLVFTYVYPTIGLVSPSAMGGAGVSTIVLPGVVAFSALFCGIFAVGMPLALDLGLTREIDDRALAPITRMAIPLVRLGSGATQAIATALLVPAMVAVVAVEAPDFTNWRPWLAVIALIVCGLCTASIGLLIAGLVPIQLLPAVLTVVHLPLTFLSAGYYPWEALSNAPVLRGLLLLNPMTFVCEALRAALTPQVPHMAPAISLPAALTWTAVMATVGTRKVVSRINGAHT